MDVRTKIGQLFMVGFDGLVANDHIIEMIRQYRVGGVILFRRNVESPKQVAELCRQLQEINASVSDIPLLIAIDQEGGMVMRIEQGVTPVPSAMAIGEAGSVSDCEQLNLVLGEELRAMGVNMNLAPVLDVNNNRLNPVIGVRAYGETPSRVADFGLAAMRGQQQSGVAVVVKHFPGHGDTSVDSHYGLPKVAHDRARLDQIELVPFKAAIKNGVNAIMTAHVVFPAIEPTPNLPATLSKAVLTGLLREELGFDGVIITDCLEMAAIADGIGVTQGALDTLSAGADIALISHQWERQANAIDAVLAAYESGQIDTELVERAVQRVQRLKQLDAIQNWRSSSTNLSKNLAGLMQPSAVALAEKIQRNGLRVEPGFKPLRRDLSVRLITVEMRSRTEIDEPAAQARGSMLVPLRAAGLQVSELVLGFDANQSDIEQAVSFAQNAQQIVIQTYNAVLSEGQQQLLAQLEPEKLWLVAGRLPYDVDLVLDAAGRISAFGCRPAALSPLVNRLLQV